VTERNPSPDEAAGMVWWNGLTERQRAQWLDRAGSAVVAEAWAVFKDWQGCLPLNVRVGADVVPLRNTNQ